MFVQKGPVDISRVCSEGTSRHKSCLFRRDPKTKVAFVSSEGTSRQVVFIQKGPVGIQLYVLTYILPERGV